MSASKILFSLSISFIAGIFFQSLIKMPHTLLWGILIGAMILSFLSVLFKKWHDVFIIGFCLMFYRQLEHLSAFPKNRL